MKLAALLSLAFLTSAAWALTDCEICQIITPIYGACSPELVANYANKTGLTVEWICLTDSPISANTTLNDTPITAIGFEEGAMKIFSTKGNIKIFISKENFREWGLTFDEKTGIANWWIAYNASKSSLTPTPISFKIYAPFSVARSNTQFGLENVFINFSSNLPITSTTTAYGADLSASLVSRTGIYNITGTIGKVDLCSWLCVDIRDFVQSWGECSGCTNVVVGSTFGYFRAKVDDIYNTCTLVGGSRCTEWFKYNGDGAVVVIPTSDATKKIDCNGTACSQSITSISGTWYYRWPKCRKVDSGYIVRTEFDTTGIISGNAPYSCLAPATRKTLITDDDEDIRAPAFPYALGLSVFGIMAIGYVMTNKEGKNAA